MIRRKSFCIQPQKAIIKALYLVIPVLSFSLMMSTNSFGQVQIKSEEATVEPKSEKNISESKSTVITNNGDFFPAGTVWLNTDYPLSFGTLSKKIAVIVVSDINCLQCKQNISELQDALQPNAAFQLIQIIKANPGQSLSRQFLLQYIQQNAFNHPIGVVPDFSGFTSAVVNELPYFFTYEQSSTPSFSGGGIRGLEMLYSKIDEIKKDKQLISSCYFNQIKPSIENHWWADPFIETPTYLAADDGQGLLYVNDAAHNRIVAFDGAGNCVKIIGNLLPGFKDDYLQQSRFDHAGGMVFFRDKLYIADTYNHRLRQVDFSSERVSSLVGNGQITYDPATTINTSREPLGLPTDTEVWDNKLFVVSGTTNQIFEVDVKSGVANLFVSLPASGSVSLMRISALNLAASSKYLYVVMSDGTLWRVDKKKKVTRVAADSDWKISAVVEWKGQLYGCDAEKSVIGLLEKDQWTIVAGSGIKGDLNGDALSATFNRPTDMVVYNSELYICDNQNHLIRRLTAPKSGKVKNFNLVPSRELMGETAAHTYGEMVVMDTLFVSTTRSNIHVIIDFGGYELVPDGRNEIDMDERMTGVIINDFDVTSDGFNFEISSEFNQTDLYMELYLTVTDPQHPGVFLAKRAYLVYPVELREDAPAQQEILYGVNLLPY